MKILVVPDMHGSHAWEAAIPMARDAEHVVFLGDWVDNWDNGAFPDQDANMRASFDFCREDPVHRHWLIGNHDWSYLSCSRCGASVSGHQSGMAGAFRSVLQDNIDLIHIGVSLGGWVFSHAGFSSVWASYMKEFIHSVLDRDGSVWDEGSFSLQFLDSFLLHDHFCPQACSLLDWHGRYDGSGDEAMQGPLWIRPSSLLGAPLFPDQVVGHTEMCFGGMPARLRNADARVMVLDSREHGIIHMFDTDDPGEFVTVDGFNRARKYWVKDMQRKKSANVTAGRGDAGGLV